MLGGVLYSQQLPIYSQYMYNKFMLNPAVAGADGYSSVNINTRQQWAGLEGAPKLNSVSFQSRFGRAQWLQPYTAETLENLGKSQTRRVDIVCPGFVSDCLETLEEIAIEGKKIFIEAGGKEYHYIPCLNERTDWIAALADIVQSNLQGWLESGSASPEELEQSRVRALRLGASQ